MEKLLEKLLHEYNTILKNLNKGYPLNKQEINLLMELVNVIDCIKYCDLTQVELIKIINHYA